MRTSVKNLLQSASAQSSVKLCGWVRTRRDSKGFAFVEINDGSCLQGIQVIVDAGIPGADQISRMSTGASVEVLGELVESPGQGQSWEVRATGVQLVGGVPEDFPLQKKGHTP
ncbi:MAG: OB-fold nucleic acid binding domain-containing protein, partial [Akkermansiaceae bacterium]|nr:OB-fold nucleic acid binding domain-containing protein [Akkermansiaceae bacterium]